LQLSKYNKNRFQCLPPHGHLGQGEDAVRLVMGCAHWVESSTMRLVGGLHWVEDPDTSSFLGSTTTTPTSDIIVWCVLLFLFRNPFSLSADSTPFVINLSSTLSSTFHQLFHQPFINSFINLSSTLSSTFHQLFHHLLLLLNDSRNIIATTDFFYPPQRSHRVSYNTSAELHH
jgi:hypothetical protein